MVSTPAAERNTPAFLKVTKFSALTGLSTRTIRRAVNRGELPHVRIGGVILIPRTVLEIDAHQVIGEQEAESLVR